MRILTQLEERYAAFDGLNLTWETIEGVAKHNGPVADAKRRPSLRVLDGQWDLQLASYASAEAQIANLADDIAYLAHDVDDSLRAGLFTSISCMACQLSPQFCKSWRPAGRGWPETGSPMS